MTDNASNTDLRQLIQQLTERVDALELSAGNGRLSIGVMSGNLDTTIAAFIIALGAIAYDMEVDMFFTFWATAALRDPRKFPAKQFMDKMFGWMLPRGSRAASLKDANGRHRTHDDSLRYEFTWSEIAGTIDEGGRRIRRSHPRL